MGEDSKNINKLWNSAPRPLRAYLCLFFMICSVIHIIGHLYNIYNYDYHASILSEIWIFIKVIVKISLIVFSLWSIHYFYTTKGCDKLSKLTTSVEPLIIGIFIPSLLGFVDYFI